MRREEEEEKSDSKMVERAEVTVPTKPKSQDSSCRDSWEPGAVVLAELRYWSQRLSHGCQTRLDALAARVKRSCLRCWS